MFITRIQLKNWRNFRTLDLPLRGVTYLLGPNASGKSNLLDAFRFLRDIAKQKGGGLQTAVDDRDGIARLRCLHARRDPEVMIEVDLADAVDGPVVWRYRLGFKPEGKGAQRILVSQEKVWSGGRLLLDRPNDTDRSDPALLTQTHLEQIQSSAGFRDVVDMFSGITYLHLVPQMLKFGDRIGGRRLDNDPFGQGFLDRLAMTPESTRKARLARIAKALAMAVPQFRDLEFKKDDLGHPHLRALYAHHRPNAGWQSEEHFSDGTLRLIGLLWALLDGNSLLLLEEPEISLNDAIVKEIPFIVQRLQRDRRSRRQVLLSTHSEALVSNPGIDGRDVLVLEPGPEGSVGRVLDETECRALEAGLSVAEAVLPATRPKAAEQLGLW